MQIYDISQELFGCCVYPGDPAPRREVLSQIKAGAVCNLTALSLCAHNGTHIDSPFHFFKDGKTVEQLSQNPAVQQVKASPLSLKQVFRQSQNAAPRPP